MAIPTTFTDLLAFRFLLASGVSLAASLGVWAVTALCRRWLPGVAAQRTVWLLSQCTVLAAFVLVLLPQGERLRLLPPIDIETVTGTHATMPAAAASGTAAAIASAAPDEGAASRSWLAVAADGWILIYGGGLAYALIRLQHTQRVLRGLAAAGTLADNHNVHIIEVDAPISPMLFGLLKPRLLLPLHLRSFDDGQRQLIVEHELTHLRRHDLRWASAGLLLQTLFWFNPFMRLLRNQLSWAQELGCDRDVLQGRPPAQRKTYAAALVAQLKLQQQTLPTALAFGNVSAGAIGSRIALIRTPDVVPRRPWTRAAVVAGLGGVLAASMAFQPSLASRADITPFACTAIADAGSGSTMRQTGHCAERITPVSTFNIVVSLMGYDSGILVDEHAPRLPYKASYDAWNEAWRADMDPMDWIKYSTVWYAQQVTSRLGADRVQHYLDSFGYGNRDLSGDPGKNNGLTLGWIGSSLKISPVEQLAFLRKIVNRQLPVSPKAYDMTARILNPQTLDNGWTVYGKTGTADAVLADGREDRQHQYGWYVGWATKGDRTIVFAHMMLDRRAEDYAGGRARQALLRELNTL